MKASAAFCRQLARWLACLTPAVAVLLPAVAGEPAQAAHPPAAQSAMTTTAPSDARLSDDLQALQQAMAGYRWHDAQMALDRLAAARPGLDTCRSAICLRIRFQSALLTSELGDLPDSYRQARALIDGSLPDELGGWTLRLLVRTAYQLKQPAQAAQWCRRLEQRIAAQPRLARDEGMQHTRIDCVRLRTDPQAMHATGSNAEDRAHARPQHAAWALQQYDRILTTEQSLRGAASTGVAKALMFKSHLLMSLHRYGEASAVAAQAWAAAWARGDAYGVWMAAENLGEGLRHQGHEREAAFYAKLGAEALQQLRNNARGLPPEQVEGLVADKREFYEDLAMWLLDDQRLPEAEQILALAREQDYQQLVRSPRPLSQPVSLNPGEQRQRAQLEPLRQAAVDAWTAAQITHDMPTAPRTDPRADLRDRLQTLQAALLRPWPDTSHSPASASESAGASASASAESATAPQPASIAAPELSFLPGPAWLHVVVRTPGQPEQTVRLPWPQAELVRDIAEFRRQLQDPAQDPRALAASLYQRLWLPLAPWLPASQPDAPAGAAPTLVLRLEGALRYLPFATLYDGRHWLGEGYALSQDAGLPARAPQDGAGPRAEATSTSTPRQGWALLGASGQAGDLLALPHVPQEIERIGQIAAAHGVSSLSALDTAFTPQALQQALATRQIVHIASHFRLVPGDGEASGLYLGDGQWLPLRTLGSPDYRFDGLDLLTLSACETAVPAGPDADGSAIDSLAWLAQARGARHVLASVWAVEDDATSTFMAVFYDALADGLPKAQALREARRRLIATDASAASPPPTSNRRGLGGLTSAPPMPTRADHPYRWGGFVLLSARSTGAD